MATTPRTGKPYVYVTWLTGLLSGDKQCVWAGWFRAHFRYTKAVAKTFNAAAWSADHNRLVAMRRAELQADGWTVQTENENQFRLEGETAVLAGRPDLVAWRGDKALVSEAKTGCQRASDWWQVLIYLFALPKIRSNLRGLAGEVCYETARVPVAREELTDARRAQIAALVRRVASEGWPERTPSLAECARCDISRDDCPERVEDVGAVPILTSEF